jgi:hypothetical protein
MEKWIKNKTLKQKKTKTFLLILGKTDLETLYPTTLPIKQ